MKKVLYILFHRSVFMALALLAQIAALAIMVFSFSAYTEIFYWCCILTSVSAAVAIVGSRMEPGYKIAWLLLILPFPIFGGAFYILVGGGYVPKRTLKRMQGMLQKTASTLQEDFKADDLIPLGGDAAGQANYLERRAACPAYTNTETEYFPLGDEAFPRMLDELEKAEDLDIAVHDLIKKLATEHQRIVFNGNGYADEWVEEAENRGLPNIKTMVDAIPALTTKKAVALFEKFGVFTEAELQSRAEVQYEAYAKAINIEAKAMIDIAGKQIIPAVIKATTQLAASINAVTAACGDADVSVQQELLAETSALLSETKVALAKLQDVTAEAAEKEEGKERAEYFKDTVKPAMDELRSQVDHLDAQDHVKEKLYKELKKLKRMSQQSSEANVIQNYVETIVSLPWNKV